MGRHRRRDAGRRCRHRQRHPRRHRRRRPLDDPRPARQRALRPHRRARPRPVAALPDLAARPLAGGAGRDHGRGDRERPGVRRDPGGRRRADGAVADARGPRLRAVGPDDDRRRDRLRGARRGVRTPHHPDPRALMTVATITPGLAGIPDEVDVVVVGLGITGAGVALDAVTRGLTVLAVDAHDLAFGTSRWSSKLVHGGLRYLAQGQLAIARESAVERGILMEVTAPHLVHPLPMLTPVNDAMPRSRTAFTWGGLQAGDVLRRSAHTTTRTLPRPRRLNTTETLNLAPSLRADTLR